MGRRRVRLPVRAAALPATVAIAVFAGAAVVPLSAATAAPVPAKQTFVAGTGTSSSSIARITLRSSGLGIGVGFGQARTRFAGAQGNAEAESVDLGLLSTLSKAPVACGVALGSLFPDGSMPTGVAVSSGGGPAEERTASVGAGTPVQLGTQYGKATPNSAADAAVEGASLDLAGILRTVGGAAHSAATLTPGSQRAASASSSLGTLTLAGGLVELHGMHWTAAHRTGAETGSAGEFRVGSITVSGQRLPTSSPAELAAAFVAVNDALAVTGLSLHPPAVTETETGVSVSPLRLTVTATPELRAALAPALAGVQPIRTQLLELLTPFEAAPDCGLVQALGFGYLVADLALVVLGDSGGIDLDLGGARAGTQAITYANPFAVDLDPLRPDAVVPGLAPGVDPGAVPGLPGGPPVLSPPNTAGSTPPDTTAAASEPGTQELLPAAALGCRSTHDEGGGCAAHHGKLAAWLALCLIVALAALDRLRAAKR